MVDESANGGDIEEGVTDGSESPQAITSRRQLVPQNQVG